MFSILACIKPLLGSLSPHLTGLHHLFFLVPEAPSFSQLSKADFLFWDSASTLWLITAEIPPGSQYL